MADVFSGSSRLLTKPHSLILLVRPTQFLWLIKIPPLLGIDLKSTYGVPPPFFGWKRLHTSTLPQPFPRQVPGELSQAAMGS